MYSDGARPEWGWLLMSWLSSVAFCLHPFSLLLLLLLISSSLFLILRVNNAADFTNSLCSLSPALQGLICGKAPALTSELSSGMPLPSPLLPSTPSYPSLLLLPKLEVPQAPLGCPTPLTRRSISSGIFLFLSPTICFGFELFLVFHFQEIPLFYIEEL